MRYHQKNKRSAYSIIKNNVIFNIIIQKKMENNFSKFWKIILKKKWKINFRNHKKLFNVI